jgi:DHA1 family tetracycline resistance protein-like MFS transporter
MKVTNQKPKKILTILLASILMDLIGFGIVIPLLPFYAQSFGASPLEVGLLMGLFPLMGIFAPTLWGSLSDRIGRRPALLFNIVGTALSYLWLSLANSLGMLFMARILAGASSGSIVIAQSYVSDLTTPDNRTKTLSFLEAAAGIGFVLGPAIGGFLLGSDSSNPDFRLPGLAATVASTLTFCLAFLALPQFDRSTSVSKFRFSPQQFFTETKEVLERPLIGSIFIFGFFAFFAGLGLPAIFALWCEKRFGWGPQQFGYFIIFCCLIITAIQIGLIGRLARWLGEAKLLMWSFIIAILGLILIPFSTTVPQFLGAITLVCVGQGCMPALTSVLSQLSGAKQRGKTLGMMQSVIGLAVFLGSIWSGFLFGALGENWPFRSSVILMILVAIFSWPTVKQGQSWQIMYRRRQQKLMRLFEVLDQDKNGTIELKDFQQVGENLSSIRGWSPEMVEYQVLQTSLTGFCEMLQQLAGRDGNKKLDRIEWLQSLENDIDFDFADFFLKIIDANQDGKIEIQELKTFYQAYGIDIKDLEEAFHTMDLNKDGHISQEEFEKIFAQFLHSDDVQAPGNWFFGVSLTGQI